MNELQQRAASELRRVVQRYGAGEAEVVRAYFRQPHTADDHLEILLRQMGREVQRQKWIGQFDTIAEAFERTVDRHTYLAMLRQMAEETEHYVLLADLAEWVAGRKLEADRLLAYEAMTRNWVGQTFRKVYNPRLPEANQLINVAREVGEALGSDRGRALLHVAEGGGGGAFVECARLSGDEFRERLAAAMTSILKDEMEHGPARIDGYVDGWIHTEDEIAGDVRWLGAYMAQHLRVRNEIWGYPLSEERLAAIDRGEAEPFDASMLEKR